MVISIETELLLSLEDGDYAQRILTVALRQKRDGLTVAQCVLAAMPYERYLNTAHWQGVADLCKRAAKGRCQVCNKVGQLQAHHRTYERRGFEEPEDLIALCADCHGLFHGAGKIQQEPEQVGAPHEWNPSPPLPDVDWNDDAAARSALATIAQKKVAQMKGRAAGHIA